MRKFVTKNRFFLLYLVCIVACIFLGYSLLPKAYFANDEWLYIGGVQTQGLYFLLHKLTWIEILSGIRRPLGTLIENYFYLSYPNNPAPFILAGIVMHIVNCVSVWFLIKKITKSKSIAFLTGLFFVCSSVYVQAIVWLACPVEVLISAFFLLLSLYTLFSYRETRAVRWLWFTLLFSFIAFLLKDANVFLFAALPLVLFLYEWKKRNFTIPYYGASMALLVVFTAVRLTNHVTTDLSLAPTGTRALSAGSQGYALLAYRSVLYPLIGLVQILVPARFLTKILEFRALQPFFRIVPADAFLTGSALFICFMMFWLLKSPKRDFKPLYSAVVLYVFSFIPIAIILINRGSPFIEERYMYFPAIPVSVLAAYILVEVYRRTKRYSPVFRTTVTTVLFLGVSLYLFKEPIVPPVEPLFESVIKTYYKLEELGITEVDGKIVFVDDMEAKP